MSCLCFFFIQIPLVTYSLFHFHASLDAPFSTVRIPGSVLPDSSRPVERDDTHDTYPLSPYSDDSLSVPLHRSLPSLPASFLAYPLMAG